MKEVICKKRPKIMGTVEKEENGLLWIRLNPACITAKWMKELLPCWPEAWEDKGRS